MTRALVVGEALVDVVERSDGSRVAHPGGSPANVAIGLGRLGRPVDLLTWFGDDVNGRSIADHLAESAVRVAPGSPAALRTSTAAASIAANGQATYAFDLDWQVPAWLPTDPPLVVHTGSIATTLEPGGAAVVEVIRRLRDTSTVTYDPNLRPAIMGSPDVVRGRVAELVALADVVKVSDEDLAWLQPDGEPDDICATWAAAGPAVVVLTRGGDGASAWTCAGDRLDVPAVPVDVVDTVGAGDSFMAALIDEWWSAGVLGAERRDSLRSVDPSVLAEVVRRCVRVAAITVSRAGADPPWAHEV